MNVLILKLNATGDVVRTTSILRKLAGEITWLTAPKNVVMVEGIRENLRCLSWEDRDQALDREYDLIINLEDEEETARFAASVRAAQIFGAYLSKAGVVCYTADSHRWFDLSLISVHGREKADRLKLENRRTYQDLIFEGLGWEFQGEAYMMPKPIPTSLSGDVAISPVAGPVWPMKNWAYYDLLQEEMEARGLTVNVLPRRDSLLEHLGDVGNHRCLVGGDSLPMHLALGLGVPCVSLFTCTSPWEIHDYGIQTQIVSPLIGEYFYQRGFEARATTAIAVDEVLDSVMTALQTARRREVLIS